MKPTTAKTPMSSVSSTQAASDESVPMGVTGANASSSCRPLMPPEALMSSATAWYAAS